MEFEIRPVSPSDLRELTKLLKDSLKFDASSISVDLVRFRIFEDPDFDPELNLASFQGEKIVSFVSAVNPKKSWLGSPEERGWIKVFATDQSFRHQGIASYIMERIVSELKERGAREIRFSDRGNWHFWPGVDIRYEDALEFLEKFGFKKEIAQVDFVYDLREFFYPRRISRLKEGLKADGVSIRRAERLDRERICPWIETRFHPSWANETGFAFAKEFPSVMLAEDYGKSDILGFATFDAVAPGRFGPTAVDEASRKKGIGAVLLFDAFQAMKDEGLDQAVVHWTDLLYFYSQVPGLCGIRQYWIMNLQAT